MRKKEKQLRDAVMECYRRMYREAKPPADIDEIIKSGEGRKENWFLSYTLPINRQHEIIENVCNEIAATNQERRVIYATVMLGAAPGIKSKSVVKNRCIFCGRFIGKANPKLLKIVKMKHGYFCEHCQAIQESEF